MALLASEIDPTSGRTGWKSCAVLEYRLGPSASSFEELKKKMKDIAY